MIKAVFIDMDGVVVNLQKSLNKLFGKDEGWQPKQYYIEDVWGISRDEFLAKVELAGEDFFADMDPIEEGVKLVNDLLGTNVPVIILSSPVSLSATGKIRWLRKHIPNLGERYCLTSQKHHLAGEGRILIDDFGENILGWQEYGGEGILLKTSYSDEYKDKLKALSFKEIRQMIWKHVFDCGHEG